MHFDVEVDKYALFWAKIRFMEEIFLSFTGKKKKNTEMHTVH